MLGNINKKTEDGARCYFYIEREREQWVRHMGSGAYLL